MKLDELQAQAKAGTLSGIFSNIPSEVYHAAPGVSSSYLKRAKAQSFLHAEHRRLHPKPPTDSMVFGTLVHAAIEHGQGLERYCVVSPKFDLRKTEDKAKKVSFDAENAGKLIVAQPDFDAARTIRDKVYAHPLLAGLFPRAKFEQSAWWKDPKTGVLCKIRPDALTDSGVLIDWKTTKSASFHSFRTDTFKLGYHLSAAMYLEGLVQLDIQPMEYWLVAIEREAPYEIRVFQPNELVIEAGRKDFRQALDDYAQCQAMGLFPGYGHEPVVMDIPAWALESQYEE